MPNTFSAPPKQDNWARLYTKFVSMCPDFTKDSEACRKKWSAIYNHYKEGKAMKSKLGSHRSKKCRWYQLVDETERRWSHMHMRALQIQMGPSAQPHPTQSQQRNKARRVHPNLPSLSVRKKFFWSVALVR
ncbi:hypothetical protein M758_UG260600 [Ceratodon purpureus]|nr:hypothetical protein M758_UG260600 [Ceratodon purpureus]